MAKASASTAAERRNGTKAIYPSSPDSANAGSRHCDSPGCDAYGVHRAPKSPAQLNDYYWFCLDHVRAYNRAWNYNAGMNAAELEREVRRAATWDRPSWRFGTRQTDPARRNGGDFGDPFDLLREGRTRTRPDRPCGETHDRTIVRALDTMGLSPPVDRKTLKARYNILVKRNHPDRNGGSREAEERLKLINEAYTTLKDFLS